MNIVERFSKILTNVEYPESIKTWNIAGILPNSNEHQKFDVRDMFKLDEGGLGKKVKLNTKVDKIVFETNKEWIILDQKEYNNYLLKNKPKVIQLEILINNLDWTKFISKE
mgnify:FL=1|jgi:hypothetical protein|tara:strand:- start:1175 stop:1507 length:333 start_codon:yes stop_codon:yes gene_type:complete